MMLSHQKLIQSLAVAVMLLAPTAASAQPRHPRYLHARSDLRRAYLFMRVHEEPNVERDLNIAAEYVVGAIREIDNAARWDRRDIDDNPPVDTHLGRGSRFREIIRLLESARADIDGEEDNPMAREWRNRAFRFIDDSIAMVRKGGYDKFRDEVGGMLAPPPPTGASYGGAHPHYLHAISDLRYARALLYRSDWRDVMRDQRHAVEEIDRAIDEAKRAAIEDGKNIDDHPPIDVRTGWEGRFHQAMDLLDSALRDLSSEEDNRDAAAWRSAARGHVQAARDSVTRAMRDSWWR
jgi:tetratricopeptide (TPR) repeat protein